MVYNLLAQCGLALHSTHSQALDAIQGMLRLSAHILSPEPHQLASQMWGRLAGCANQKVRRLLDDALSQKPGTWLRPTSPSLDLPGGSLVTIITPHVLVNCLAASEDGSWAVSGAFDNTLTVWDLTTGAVKRRLIGHSGPVNAVVLTPGDNYCLSGSDDTTLILWDLLSGAAIRVFKGHTAAIRALALTPDGRRALSGSRDGSMKLWDLGSGAELHTISGHSEEVCCVVVTPDGHRALSASLDHTVRLWDLEAYCEVLSFRGCSNQVFSIAVTPDGKRAVTLSWMKFEVWNVYSGRRIKEFGVNAPPWSTAMAMTRDGGHIVAGSWNARVRLWNMATGVESPAFSGHNGKIKAVAVSGDGRCAISAAEDGTLRVWNLFAPFAQTAALGHSGAVLALVANPVQASAISIGADRRWVKWDLHQCKEVASGRSYDSIESIAFASDVFRAVASNKHRVLLWDSHGSRELGPWLNDRLAIAVTPDGRRGVTHSFNQLKVWDLVSGAEVRTIRTGLSLWPAVAITGDGSRAIVSSDEDLDVWSLESGSLLRSCCGHQDLVTAVSVSGDGSMAISGSLDHTLAVWSMDSGARLYSFPGHTSAVNQIVMALDQRFAVSVGQDRKLILFSVDGSGLTAAFYGDAALTSSSVSQDGRMILAGDELGRICFLQIEKGLSMPDKS